MIAYASATGTKRNMNRMRDHGWRIIITPDSRPSDVKKTMTMGFRYAIDNGAWGCHTRGEQWDEKPFLDLIRKHGADADFVVVPDIIEGGLESLGRSRKWIGACLDHARECLVPVQDGMAPWDVEPILIEDSRIGIFVGGSTEWKLASLGWWGRLTRARGRWLHVGRVNSRMRINSCLAAGADSFDGTSATRYAKTIPALDAARQQETFFESMEVTDAD